MKRQVYIAVTVVGICIVAGCRGAGAKAGSNIGDFIYFQDIGPSDYRNTPLAVCVDNSNQYLQQRIDKYVFYPSEILMLIKVPRDDFAEIQASVSNAVGQELNTSPWMEMNIGQMLGEEEYGAVHVAMVTGSKVRYKDFGTNDYVLLVNQIPTDVLRHNPEFATALRGLEK